MKTLLATWIVAVVAVMLGPSPRATTAFAVAFAGMAAAFAGALLAFGVALRVWADTEVCDE